MPAWRADVAWQRSPADAPCGQGSMVVTTDVAGMRARPRRCSPGRPLLRHVQKHDPPAPARCRRARAQIPTVPWTERTEG